MTAPEEIVIRVDATVAPAVVPGDEVRQGQSLGPGMGDQVFPVSGEVRSIRLDGDAHEFVIILVPNATS